MRRVFDEIQCERERQDAKWGQQNHGDGTWALILMEELGEACQAILKGHSSEPRKELIRALSVGVAWLECTARRGSGTYVESVEAEVTRLRGDYERHTEQIRKLKESNRQLLDIVAGRSFVKGGVK